MKKILATLCVASAAALSYGQGTVIINNGSATYAISTNTTSIGGTVGKTSQTLDSFYYTLLVAPYSGGAPSTPTSAGWTATLTGVNFQAAAGGVQGQGGVSGAAASNWAPSADATATDGTEDYFQLVGWSASLGTTWSTVSTELKSGNVPAGALFGASAIGYGYTGGGAFSLPASDIWGVTTAMPGGLTSGFQLTPVPEPSTIALGIMGACSFLALRRKKA